MTESKTPELTIFYDSTCPLCVAEMDKLRGLDSHHRIALVSLQDESVAQRYPQLDVVKAMSVLQGLLASGRYIEGLDVTHRAWTLVGRGYLTAPLRWPGIRWLADRAYLWFARNRYRVSALLTGKSNCDNGQCSVPRK
ncbi:MAG: DUF393 domain-containing protein [Candidatus Pelagadaptatus aseana]|uniref:thiol-disulfide oxidoreductase DCC family protein n=1 Tax=Candidatus Pelagadaptatus aseana TaxID=3120508 RepID=UPI0039B2104A